MSIINEALKKTQASLNKGITAVPRKHLLEQEVRKNIPETAPAPRVKIDAPSRPRKNWWAVILLEILVLVFIAGVLFVWQPRFFQTLNTWYSHYIPAPNSSVPAVPPAPSAVTTAPSPVTQPAVPVAVTETATPESLVLSGIMMVEDKRVALINGEVYEMGEHIDGFKITNISLDRVELSNGVRTRVLSVRRRK